jgi:hypothetical protein
VPADGEGPKFVTGSQTKAPFPPWLYEKTAPTVWPTVAWPEKETVSIGNGSTHGSS